MEGQQLGCGQGNEHGGLLALTGEKRNEPCPPAVAAKGTVYRESSSLRLGGELMRGGVGRDADSAEDSLRGKRPWCVAGSAPFPGTLR